MKTNDGIHPLTPDELRRASGLPNDFIAVYEAAARERDRTRRRDAREERRKRTARRRLSAVVLVALAVVLCIIIVARAVAMEHLGAEETPEITPPPAVSTTTPDPPEMPSTEAEGRTEPEMTEEAMLAQGYLSIAVPLSYDLQDVMRTACAEYNCPYPLALAVAEIESQFDVNAVGAIGEVGIMQLNPGPGGAYHAALEDATGADPTTPEGNIICGVYLLGKYMDTYGVQEKAIMAYNMGEGGAKKAWAAGVTSTEYTTKILEAVEGWECTVNAWNGT